MGSVYRSFPPCGSMRCSGSMMNSKIRWMNVNEMSDADGQRADRIDDPLPELVEMLQKRHLRAGRLRSSSDDQRLDASDGPTGPARPADREKARPPSRRLRVAAIGVRRGSRRV